MTYKDALRRLTGSRHGATPQTQPLAGQVANHAGGYAFPVDDWTRLERFLVLGSDTGTYYVSGQALTLDNAGAVQRCLAIDGQRAVAKIVEIGSSARAPRQQPALFALALATAAADDKTRQAALAALPKVARTGTHVLTFAAYVDGIRGWGRGLRRSVARWFCEQPAERLALQAVKYRQREGWSLRDLMRLAHPLTDELERRALFDWIAHPADARAVQAARERFRLIDGVAAVRESQGADAVAETIVRYSLPREAVPTQYLNEAVVWDALLVDMPMTAMIRNLGKMTQVGLLANGSDAVRYVADRLIDDEALAAARVHPIQLLLALKTYASGRGALGRLSWTPDSEIVDALDMAFHEAFNRVEPIRQRLLVAVDVSASMLWRGGFLMPVEAAGAMALQFLHAAPSATIVGFNTRILQPGLSRRQRLDDAVHRLARYGGGTDVALPMRYALEQRMEVDAFVILTDHETWAGRQHPVEALAAYRDRVNPDAKVAMLAFAANHVAVVPEDDPMALGVAGFDAAVPQVLNDFLSG